MTLTLSEELRALAEARAAESGHASLEDYVEALIRADAMTETEGGAPSELTVRTREELEAKLLEGLQSPAAEMTPADWQEMRRQFLRRHSSTDAASA